MGKINIEIITKDSLTEKNQITFSVDDCTENQLANALYQTFLIVMKNGLVRKKYISACS